MTKYHFLTKKIESIHVAPGKMEALTWTKISPLTSDATVRGMIPGEYAVLGENVYIVPQNRPKAGKKRITRRKNHGNRD